MIAHILCPGPSLPRTFVRRGIGPVIAVNRACDYTTADWLVAGDSVTLGRLHFLPMTGLCTFNATARDLPPAWRSLRVVCWEDLPMQHTHPQYGVEAALLLARHLAGGDHLTAHLFGVDHAGITDWDGAEPIDDRSPTRWQREAQRLQQLITTISTTTRTEVVWHRA
jgi:hypothetical protein